MKGNSGWKALLSNQYDFDYLVRVYPELEGIVKTIKGRKSIDFTNAQSVYLFNKALLSVYFDIDHWHLPNGYLCPAVPGRMKYLQIVDQLISPTRKLKGLDIGTGAGLIYPILGRKMYNWTFVASDIHRPSIKMAKAIASFNPILSQSIKVKHQPNKSKCFENIIDQKDYFDFTMCNPPFFKTVKEMNDSHRRKNSNLTKKENVSRNFEGQHHELVYQGGELRFVAEMIKESENFKRQVNWFTSLISKKKNLDTLVSLLEKTKQASYQIISFNIGNKESRILAWTFNKNI